MRESGYLLDPRLREDDIFRPSPNFPSCPRGGGTEGDGVVGETGEVLGVAREVRGEGLHPRIATREDVRTDFGNPPCAHVAERPLHFV